VRCDPRRRRVSVLLFAAVVSLLACSRSHETTFDTVSTDRVHLVTRVPLHPLEQQAQAPVPVGGEVTLPALIHRVEPAIPAGERSKIRRQPWMLFQLTIDSSGNVVDVTPLRSTDQVLLPYVVAAIKQWKYRPATLRGRPVSVFFNITFTYEVR
jgi:Gram-negative bacterial TonB protein C-terminal